MANFKQLLSVDASKVEKPKPIPVGTYDGVITGYKFDESQQNKTPFCRVTIRPQQAGADVDQEAFANYGGQANLVKKEVNVDFWLTDEAMYRFRQLFEEVLGLNVQGQTFDTLAPQMTGQGVKFEIVHVPSKDGTSVYSNVKRLLKA